MRKYLKKILLENNIGANVVEFALVLIILALLITGIADLGRAFHSYIVITNASREGARLGARVQHTDEIDTYIEQAVIQEAATGGIDLADEDIAEITIEPDRVDRDGGFPITVTVEYTIPMVLTSFVGIDELPMRSQTAMLMFGSDAEELLP